MAESKPPRTETPPRSATDPPTMLPHRAARRSLVESIFVRVVATCGVVGINVAIAAIMGSSGSAAWVIGLVVSIVSVVLAAILWSTRQL